MADIKYHFIADGQASVRDAFRSIGEEAKSSSKAIEQGMRAIRASNRATSADTLKQQKAESERAKVVESAIDIRRKQAEDLAKRVAQDQAIQAKITASQRKEVDKRQKEAARDIAKREALQARDRTNEQRHVERLNAIRDRQSQREERDKQKLQALENRHREKLEASKSKYDEIFQKRKDAIHESRAAEFKAGARGAFIGGSAAVVASALGVAGSAARQSLALHEISNRLSISARGAGEEAVDPAKLRKEFEQTAAKTPGIAAVDIANAVQQFVTKTGELGVARKSQGVFATVASATGSNVADVAGAAADLFQKFDINTVEGMADAMAALAFQGKAGAFELKDAASQFASMSAAAARFGLAKGAEGVRVLGGLSQLARSTTKTPEAAATAVNAMFRQFVSNTTQGDFKKLGVQVFKDKNKTQTRDIQDLLVETIGKAGGNQTTLSKIFQDEGMGAVTSMVTEFNRAQQEGSKQGLSGKDLNTYASDALRAFLEKSINAPGDYAELQKDAAQAQQDASAKLSNAWEKIVAGLSDSVIPIFGKLAESIENSPGAIEALVGTIENLASAFGFLIEATQAVMEWMGIATGRKKSPEQKEAEARQKAKTAQDNLDRFDKKRGGNWEQVKKLETEAKELDASGKKKEAEAKRKEASVMTQKLLATADQDDQRAGLAAKLEMAKKDVGLARGETATTRDEKHRIRTAEEFATEYAAKLNLHPEEAKDLSRRVAAQMKTFQGTESMMGDDTFRGETEEAKQFRMSQASERNASAQIAMYGQDSKSSDNQTAAMAKIEAAAAKLESAANAIKSVNQTSIVPQP